MGIDIESLSEATSGAIGSLLSTTILCPLDTCKTKYQAEARAHGIRKYRCKVVIEAADNDDSESRKCELKSRKRCLQLRMQYGRGKVFWDFLKDYKLRF